MIRIPEYVQKLKRLGMQAGAVTDHGVLSGAPEFYFECKKHDVMPIIGEEFYVAQRSARPAKDPHTDKVIDPAIERQYWHLVLLARNYEGYKTLVRLSTESHRLENFYYKPRIDKQVLSELGNEAENLVCLSGCWQGEVSFKIRNKKAKSALKAARWYADIFPSFYLEIQDHHTQEDRALNEVLVKINRMTEIPLVMTGDAHYLNKNDAEIHSHLLAIQTGASKDDPERFSFQGSGFHVKPRSVLERDIAYLGSAGTQALDNSVEIAHSIDTAFPLLDKRVWRIPQWRENGRVPEPQRHLEKLVSRFTKKKRLDATYKRRLRHELDVIAEAGVAAYLLIVRDIIVRARSSGTRVGIARGSVAGSAVAWAIGITKVDPITYDLLFDRFLSPARPKLPDIDVDFSKADRDRVIQDIEDTYGSRHTIHIGTFGRMGARTAVKSVASSLRVDYGTANRITAEIPEAEHLESWIRSPEFLHNEVLAGAAREHPELFPVAARLQGLKKSMGTHAGGVLIGDETTPLREALPTMRTSSKTQVSQYDMYMTEKMGLLKIDVLGLRTLDTIDLSLKYIKERHGEEIDPDELDPYSSDSRKVYRMLASGYVAGVFQMEGSACEVGCREVGVREFEDIVAITALYRPGPDRFIGDFLRGRKEPSTVVYSHPGMRNILEKTFGVIVYQEQAMEIGGRIAGFDASLVDEIKETIKAKDPARMAAMEPKFISGCQEHSRMSLEDATALWGKIRLAAGYMYNRAHAVSYSLITYQTAWLKYHYPLEYMTALLATTDKEDRARYHRECRALGLVVLPPDIQRSEPLYTVENDSIRMGLNSIKYVGQSRCEKIFKWIAENGPIKGRVSLDEACGNAQAANALIQAGACRSIGLRPDGKPASLEMEYLDTYVSHHPVDAYEKIIKKHSSSKGSGRILGGLVARKKPWKDKRGRQMCFLEIDLYGEQTKVVVFADQYEEIRRKCPEGAVVLVAGRWDGKSLVLNKLVRLDK